MPLHEPSRESAARFLSPVRYEQRLVGARMSPMGGVHQYPVYGFREAVNFLQIDSAEEVLAWGPRASVPYVDPKVLRVWVEEVFGDSELAEAIAEVIHVGDNYPETMGRIRELMCQRLSQCEAVLEADEGAT